MAVDDGVCLQATSNRGRCDFPLQNTEDLLSPVPPVGGGLVNPSFDGGRPFVCAENVSTSRVCGAVVTATTLEASVPHQVRICPSFFNGSDSGYGENCRYRDPFASGEHDDFHLVTTLEGFRKPITGIAFPAGTNKLVSCSIDTLKLWDTTSGECIGTSPVDNYTNLGPYPRSRFLCMVGIDNWVFFGVPGALKAWSPGIDLSLEVFGGRRVYTVAFGDVNGDKFLFAGLQEGSILVWRWNATGKVFETSVAATSSLANAHPLAIRSLVLQGERLYSGSMDHTIKVWDLANLPSLHYLARLQCLQTLAGHTDAVTSLLFWGPFLLSGSLDRTVRVWDSLKLEQIYEHKVKPRVVALAGAMDGKSRPVLMCSGGDFTIYLYDLPSFAERGKILSGDEVKHIVTGPEGLFFTGNGSGELKVWKWNGF